MAHFDLFLATKEKKISTFYYQSHIFVDNVLKKCIFAAIYV